MNTWRIHGRRIIVTSLLLAGAALARAQTLSSQGQPEAAMVPSPVSGAMSPAAHGGPRTTCPPPTGTRIPASPDASGRCPSAAKTDPRVRSYSGNEVEATGYPGALGPALQRLDPSLIGR